MKSILVVASLIMISGMSFAQDAKAQAQNPELVVFKCNDKSPTSLSNYLDVKSFSNGAVRIFYAGWEDVKPEYSGHLIIYMRDNRAPPGTPYICFQIATIKSGAAGFSYVDLAAAKSDYKAETGLTITLPFEFFSSVSTSLYKKNFNLVINQAAQTVTVSPVN